MTTTDACLTKVTFDPSSMEVLEYSADFVALLGQRPMHNVFETWVAENNRREFMKHFRNRVAQWRASSATVVRVSYRNMSLKIPLSANATFRFSSTCTMVLTMKIDPEEYAGEGRPVAEAIFTDIKLEEPLHRGGAAGRGAQARPTVTPTPTAALPAVTVLRLPLPRQQQQLRWPVRRDHRQGVTGHLRREVRGQPLIRGIQRSPPP
eukprot:CAMPEP_0175487096 /NCGR_PEP_ID=MMETSP0095-20121207/81364_1 /TAXON_ID=311494 /ORGANISM="Alexandrium monilatum, Strain CCMP3105" /LENGTH=206 /DNA_ID=CAMNT_0016788899 /DNA_START=11 /DNA_END=629 /DNA_ORIENTATION=+